MKKLLTFAASVVLLLSLFLFGCGTVTVVPDFPPFNSGGEQGGEPETPPPSVPLPPETELPDNSVPLPPDNPEPNPEPLPPKPPLQNKDVLVMATTGGLNVRNGAGASYSKIGVMDVGDMLKATMLKGEWYEVEYKNSKGYVSKQYLKEVAFEKGNDAVERVVREGQKLMGLPYVYGAERYHWGNGSLNSNFDGRSYDCSSLTQYIFKKGASVNLKTTSREQSLQGSAVSKRNIKRGDLMFFTNASRFNNTGIDRIGHVAMYLGDNYILHTASDFAVTEQISTTRWGYFINARRFV